MNGPLKQRLPAGIWALGFGSLFMDMSSELIHVLLPLYLAGTLGVSMLVIGAMEGVAEAAVSFTKLFSGALSDRMRRRKPIVLAGYALGALTKPVFPLAGSVAWIFGARLVDRIGKGIRGAPRDALVADIAPPGQRGAAYGLRQALDSVGAVLGPLLAIALLIGLAGDLRAAMWVAVVPAVLSVAVLAAFVREAERAVPAEQVDRPPMWRGFARLPAVFWAVTALGAVFTLARFSEAFLVLRAQDLGFAVAWIPLVMVTMNVFYASGAWPAGAAADRIAPRWLLAAGLAVLVAAELFLAFATGPAAALVGASLWGLHMALTQGLLAKLVADAAPPELRGTAFGVFNFAGGIAMIAASVVAGALWDALGPAATFLAGAAFAAIAAFGSLLVASPARRPGA